MGKLKDYWNNNLDSNLTEVQMLQRVKGLKSKEKVEFELKNLREDKVGRFKRKIQDMNYYMVVDSGKIIVTKP